MNEKICIYHQILGQITSKMYLPSADQLQFSTAWLHLSCSHLTQQERDLSPPSSWRIMPRTCFPNIIALTICALLEINPSFRLILIKVPYLVHISNKLNQDF